MDKQTHGILKRITSKIPSRLHKITHEVVDTSEEDRVKAMLGDRRLPNSAKNKLRGLLEKGAFRRSETVEDERTIQELDKYHSREIQKAIRTGRLKDPMTDPYYRKRMQRKARANSQKNPLTEAEKRAASGRLNQSFKNLPK